MKIETGISSRPWNRAARALRWSSSMGMTVAIAPGYDGCRRAYGRHMLATTSVVIPRRFNGPEDGANGGYGCGVFSGLVDGPAEVSLRSPIPLDTRMTVERGAPVRVL